MGHAMNDEAWRTASSNIPVVAKSKVYCVNKFRRRYGVESYDEMYGDKKQAVGDNLNFGKKDKNHCAKE